MVSRHQPWEVCVQLQRLNILIWDFPADVPLPWFYGNASTRNQTQKNRNLPKMNFFKAFPVFSKIIGNPSNPIFRGISHFFWSVSLIYGQIPLYQGLICFKFSVCWSVSSFFESVSSFFGSVSSFSGSVSSFFGSVSGFQKKFQILSLLIGFLFFGPVSSFFG